MRQTLFLIALLLFTSFAFGQKHRPIRLHGLPTKAEEAKANRNFQCLHTNRYLAKERRTFFPFATAASVRLISFEGGIEPNYDIIVGAPPIPAEDTLQIFSSMRVDKFFINYCRIIELADLTNAGIDSLTDILYNVGYTPVKGLTLKIAGTGASCYNPRNAILFLDAKGNVTQYIEFCFGCHRYYYSSSKTKSVDYCEQKFDMLSQFFASQNIKYGTGKNID